MKDSIKLHLEKEKNRWTLGKFIWMLYNKIKEYNSLSDYSNKVIMSDPCNLAAVSPSRALRRDRGIEPGSPIGLAWYLLEQYEKGNILIQKEPQKVYKFSKENIETIKSQAFKEVAPNTYEMGAALKETVVSIPLGSSEGVTVKNSVITGEGGNA